MSLRFEVRRIDGSFVCVIEANLDQHCKALRQQVSDHLGICMCKVRLVADTNVVRDGLCVKRIRRFIEPHHILTFIEEALVLTTVADLHARGVCFQCMKELGVQATEILALPIPVDVAALRAAGFSLEDLLRARKVAGLHYHPPVSNRTLFDSQLKAGGFSASDFHRAGYEAEDLSYEAFWQDGDELTYGEIEWEQCCAFFTASDLKSAGYDASALRKACFSVQDLKAAGFSLTEVKEAGYTAEELDQGNAQVHVCRRESAVDKRYKYRGEY